MKQQFLFKRVPPPFPLNKNNSVDIADKIQDEDRDICESVQRGLLSKGYDTGRLSVEKEAGEHLFHQLLHHDLSGFLIQT